MYTDTNDLKSRIFDALSEQSLRQMSASLREGGLQENGGSAESTVQLDLLPHVLSQDEFYQLATGAAQWGEYLSRVYRDMYGSQNLVARGILSPETLWTPPNFHPEFYHLVSENSPPITMLQLDVIRTAEGFRLTGVDASPLSLLGNVVECRINQSRVFGQRIPRDNVRRIAPFFIALKELWKDLSPRKIEEPNIMLWSPGLTDARYPVHSFLARYFGVPLVESRDLTFRSGKMYLKLLEGLKQVDVLVRFVADGDLDPLGTVSREARGVAGLLECMRNGTVAVCNAPGTDIFSRPDMFQALGSSHNPLMPDTMILPLATATDTALEDPCFSEDGWGSAPVTLKLFARFDERGWWLMGGGLAEIQKSAEAGSIEVVSSDAVSSDAVSSDAVSSETRLAGIGGSAAVNRAGNICKDIWVMSRKDVGATTLLPTLEKPSEIRRGSDIPSRIADDLYWLGRHSERIWLDIQFLEKWLAMESEVPIAGSDGADVQSDDISRFIEIITALQIAPSEFEEDDDYSRWTLFNSIENFSMNARRVIDRFSLDAQRMIGRFSTDFREKQVNFPRETFDEISLLISAFNGIVMENMTRTGGWHFLEIGRRLERSLLLCESLLQLFNGAVDNNRILSLILEIFDSLMTYRSRYQLQPRIEGVADLLLLDETNPRSLAFQLEILRIQIETLPGIRDGAYRSRPERTIIDLQAALRSREGVGFRLRAHELEEDDVAVEGSEAAHPRSPADDIQAGGEYLQDFLEEMIEGLSDLSDAISERYFTKTVSSQFLRSYRGGF